MTFWAHPEVCNIDKDGPVSIETKDYPEYLLQSSGYTGYAVFYDGYEKIGKPGGMWDRVLTEFCEGKRATPPWAIGALAFDFSGKLESAMNDLRTVISVKSLHKSEVLKAMRAGRMYVAKGRSARDFILENFFVKDPDSFASAGMGDKLKLSAVPEIKIRGALTGAGSVNKIKVNLIRSGKVIKTFEEEGVFSIRYKDDLAPQGEKFYYRIELLADDLIVISNPVFVIRE
jgi:hypothetical protein